MSETKEELIQRVTEEVLAVFAAKGMSAVAPKQNDVRVLVVGNPDKLPAYLCEDCELATVEDYSKDGDISKYEKIYITSLTFAELCDIAICRDSHPAQCAVIRALLSGKEVLLLESGIPHRTFFNTANSEIYNVLEGYLHTIIGFGIKLVSDKAPQKPVEKLTIPRYVSGSPGTGRSNAAQLITENMAMDLVRAGGSVQIPQSAILTPSAKDVFFSAGVAIVREL